MTVKNKHLPNYLVIKIKCMTTKQIVIIIFFNNSCLYNHQNKKKTFWKSYKLQIDEIV